MPIPKIDMSLPITKNIKIIYGKDHNLNTKEEAEMAEAFLKMVKPKTSDDNIRIYGLNQSLQSYYKYGESAVLLHYAKAAYHYLADKSSTLYANLQNYMDKNKTDAVVQKLQH